MKRLLVILSVLSGLMFAGSVAGAQEHNHDHEELPEHPHILLLNLEFNEEGEPVNAQKCVDLANNRALPLNSHHHNVHFGTANEALFLQGQARHVVIPTSPFPMVPWTDCASFLQFMGIE